MSYHQFIDFAWAAIKIVSLVGLAILIAMLGEMLGNRRGKC